MLTGVSPVIIFKFYEQDAVWKQGETDAVDTAGNSLIGQPISAKEWSKMSEYDKWKYHGKYIIPIYLDEETIDIAVNEAEQTIAVENTTINTLNFESLITNTVNISMAATDDNPIMIALLSVLKQVVSAITKQRYSITLYYDSIFILDGRFTHIAQSRVQNTNQKAISLSIAELPYKDPVKEETKDKGGELQDTSGTSTFPGGTN